MEYPFYKNIITELYIKLNFGTAQFLMARDYSDEKVMNSVNEQNPFNIDLSDKIKKSSGNRITLGALKGMGIVK
jgi:hypothetical protein